MATLSHIHPPSDANRTESPERRRATKSREFAEPLTRFLVGSITHLCEYSPFPHPLALPTGQQGAWAGKRCQKRSFTLSSQRSEGLQRLSVELKHLKPSKAFRPDYYMRAPPPQPAQADYPKCYNRCQLIFLSLPAVWAAGLQAIFRIIADVNLWGFVERDWKTGQATRHCPSFGFQELLYNR